MKLIGKSVAALVALLVTLGGSVAMAEVSAKLDRNRASLGDTLRLTITATEDEELDDADLRALLDDFEILQRSNSSNTSIVNGHMSHVRQIIIDLTPTRQGNLQIPPLRVGDRTTPSLSVVVGDAADTPADDQTVLFEASVDRHEVYVQGQIILTLRVQQSVSLEGRSISELKLGNAFVKPLEQQSFQRTIDGRQWLVDELRYAIFPEQSGTLEIPVQVFSGRLNQRQRSFFDLGAGGRLLRRSTAALAINVLPKPDSFSADTWLPARGLTLEETWSTPPEQLQVGESATRTIRIHGEGLQGAQLPPILFAPIEGLKFYPDQPQISEQETPDGLLGIREENAAVVPTRAGDYVIPQIRIPWWDTQTEQVRYAVLPERKISVAAAAPVDSPTDTDAPAPFSVPVPPADTTSSTGVAAVTAIPPQQNTTWQILSAVSTLGWVLTLLYLWRRRQGAEKPSSPKDNTSEKLAFKRLMAACTDGDAAGARGAVITWSAALNPDLAAVSLAQVAKQFGDGELTRELELLDARLYRPGHDNWVGARLADCARRLRGGQTKATQNGEEPLRLYP